MFKLLTHSADLADFYNSKIIFKSRNYKIKIDIMELNFDYMIMILIDMPK